MMDDRRQSAPFEAGPEEGRTATGTDEATLVDSTMPTPPAEPRVDPRAPGCVKREFLNNINHAFRTPLNAVIGMMALVLDGDLTTDQRECLEVATRSAEELTELLEDLLDYSRMEAEGIELQAVSFDLRRMISEVLSRMDARAREKRLGFVVELDDALPQRVVGDPARLGQVLAKLVGNAVKFTETGRVTVQVRLAEESSGPGEVVLGFRVIDTGPGVPPEALGRIFLPFEQLDGSSTRRHDGVGLGLSFASRLVESMGGAVALETAPGAGSDFSFTARLGRPDEGP